jgi:hypothetical protein
MAGALDPWPLTAACILEGSSDAIRVYIICFIYPSIPFLKAPVTYFCFSRLWNPALGALEGLG